MNSSVASLSLTTSDIFEIADDDIEREIIRGELRERPMTRRNQLQSETMMAVGEYLRVWVRTSKLLGGKVTGGEAGIRLRRDPESCVGVDVAYFSPAQMSVMPRDQPWYEGPPVLAVEIMSLSDKHEEIVDKVELYLECGVQVVWIIDPDFQTLTVHRPKTRPVPYGEDDILDGGPELPNFRVTVSEFFN
jgi:Uma2 family endonuclease